MLPRFLSFESRRAEEMASLIARMGGKATVAPSMREIPLEDNPAVFDFADKLFAGQIDGMIFMTGVGADALREAVTSRHDDAAFLAAVDRLIIAVRGPKPTAVLKKWGVHIDVKAPEPNTWRDLLAAIQAHHSPAGKTVALQEYGKPNVAFAEELRAAGANVISVPVYRWALPEDTGPLEAAIRTALADGFDVYAFTSAQQVENVLSVADTLGVADGFRTAMQAAVIASIGPTCSEALREAGLEPTVEASPPKMGPLVRTALAAARAADSSAAGGGL